MRNSAKLLFISFSSACRRLCYRSTESSIGHVFLDNEPKFQIYEQYIKASPRSANTLQTWKQKDPHFDILIKLFQVFPIGLPLFALLGDV